MNSSVATIETLSGQATAGNVVPFSRQPVRVLINDSCLPWADEALKRLDSLVSLQTGWDGYSAPPVRFDTALFAYTMLEKICREGTPPPHIVPGTAGDLQVEWHEAGGDVELHVLAPYAVEGWHSSHGTGPEGEEREFRSDFTLAAAWIEEMMEPTGATAAEAE